MNMGTAALVLSHAYYLYFWQCINYVLWEDMAVISF